MNFKEILLRAKAGDIIFHRIDTENGAILTGMHENEMFMEIKDAEDGKEYVNNAVSSELDIDSNIEEDGSLSESDRTKLSNNVMNVINEEIGACFVGQKTVEMTARRQSPCQRYPASDPRPGGGEGVNSSLTAARPTSRPAASQFGHRSPTTYPQLGPASHKV